MHTTLKRDRLIEAAKIMCYQQGVTSTTLADIAQQAQVPLGNIYYHFRTKEALVEAVIQAHLQELQSLFTQLDCQPAPRQRLLGLLAAEREGEQGLARYGCPHGSLSQELNKEDGQPATTAALLLQAYLDWTATQFRLFGKDEEEAKDLAMDLISSLPRWPVATLCRPVDLGALCRDADHFRDCASSDRLPHPHPDRRIPAEGRGAGFGRHHGGSDGCGQA